MVNPGVYLPKSKRGRYRVRYACAFRNRGKERNGTLARVARRTACLSSATKDLSGDQENASLCS
jgi:hypothetical protein